MIVNVKLQSSEKRIENVHNKRKGCARQTDRITELMLFRQKQKEPNDDRQSRRRSRVGRARTRRVVVMLKSRERERERRKMLKERIGLSRTV
jgi:hypothetical protein